MTRDQRQNPFPMPRKDGRRPGEPTHNSPCTLHGGTHPIRYCPDAGYVPGKARGNVQTFMGKLMEKFKAQADELRAKMQAQKGDETPSEERLDLPLDGASITLTSNKPPTLEGVQPTKEA